MALADARKREAAGKTPPFSLFFYGTLCLLLWLPWFSFAAVGALVGPALGYLDRWGLDMVSPAIFLVLVRGLWTTARAARPWLVSLVTAGATHFTVPGAWYVPAGAVAGLFAAWWWTDEQA